MKSLLTERNIKEFIKLIATLSSFQIFSLAFLVLTLTISYTIYTNPGLITDFLEKRALSRALETTATVGPEIEEEIKVLREDLEATTVTYFRYHNGTQSAGFPFIFKSAIFSVNTPRWINDISRLQHLSASADIKQLTTHIIGECLFRLVDSDHTIAYNALLRDDGIKQLASCPIFNNGILVGYLSVGWNYTRINVSTTTSDSDIALILNRIGVSADNIETIHLQ